MNIGEVTSPAFSPDNNPAARWLSRRSATGTGLWMPVPIMAELKKYISGLNSEQEKIFIDRFNEYRWKKIRERLGLSDFKFHDLRKTFGSVLAQKGVSTAVVQRLLEHSSADLTNKVYTNVDPVLRQAVDLIPAGEWL